MKRILLTALFTGLFAAASFAQEADADEPVIFKTSDGFRFQVNAADPATVSLLPVDNGYKGDVTVPSQATDDATGTTYTVTALGEEAFYGSRCGKITLPSTVSVITGNAFFNCTMKEFAVDAANTGFTTVDGVLYNKDMTTIVSFPNGKDFGGYTLPETITAIGDYAFCSVWLQQFDVPSQVESIGAGAFMDTSLRTFEVPATVKSVGEGALQNCVSLTSVTFPEGMTLMPDHILASSYMLEKVNFPSTLTRIGLYAFSGTFVYDYGNLITEITVPDNVTAIDAGAFDGCRALKTVTLGSSLATIDLYAFSRCSGLTKLVSLNTTPPFCLGMSAENDVTGAFNEVPSTCVLYVPEGSSDAYRASWGTKFADI